jgi:hypothetical protein
MRIETERLVLRPVCAGDLDGYRALGIRRVMALVPGAVTGDAALETLARDAREAGAELA